MNNYEERTVTSKRYLSNPLALAVLAMLAERPMHPYEIGAVLRERMKHESIRLNYGSLYTVIEALQRNQLIEARETIRDGKRPERTIYTLCEAGRTELFSWLRDLLREPAKEYTQFAAGLSFAPLLPPEEVVALLEERTQQLEREVDYTRARMEDAIAQGIPRLYLIEGEHEQVLREAELRWVREIIAAIQAGTLSGMAEWLAYHAEQGASGEERKETGETSE